MFQIGDQVVCVDDQDRAHLHPELLPMSPVLRRGDVYTIADVWLGPYGEPTVALVEAKNPNELTGEDEGFYADRFRKVQRKNTDISAWLAQPTDYEEPKRAPKKERVS